MGGPGSISNEGRPIKKRVVESRTNLIESLELGSDYRQSGSDDGLIQSDEEDRKQLGEKKEGQGRKVEKEEGTVSPLINAASRRGDDSSLPRPAC